MTLTANTRTVQQPAPIHKISEREFARTIADALRRHYGPLKASAKSCAGDAGVSPATARNWMDGLCPPSSFFLKKLEAKVPGLAAEMRRLTAMEQDLDPDFQREFIRFMQRVGSA